MATMDSGGAQRLRQLLENSHDIVFFGGAGVSTESGIPDFRSPEGLYAPDAGTADMSPARREGPQGACRPEVTGNSQALPRREDGLHSRQYRHPPEQIISHSFYQSNPEEFYAFYRDKMLAPALAARPNSAHLALAKLEAEGHLRAVITQNIDGLHQAAGSENVLELHGSVHRNHCQNCGCAFDAAFLLQASGVPPCPCGGSIKPDVVLYEEGLDPTILRDAAQAIAAADLLIIGGTSLVVYPAAGLVNHFSGRHLVVINQSSTVRDEAADLLIRAPIGQVLGAACGL